MQQKRKLVYADGYITLLDKKAEFVVSKKYHGKVQRQKIMEEWKKLYALDKQKHFIVIQPETLDKKS